MNNISSFKFLRVPAILLLVLGSVLVGRGWVPQQAASQNDSEVSPSQPFKPNDVLGELIDQGQRRTYYLHTPPSYGANHPMPLVLAFHGSGQQGKQMAEETGLNRLADQEGFIVVYPDGLNQKWNVSGFAPEDNVSFVHTLIAHISQMRAIDFRKIYATGLSNGGILVQKLACEAPGEIAAFATVAASLPTQFEASCQNHTPISLMMINGTNDNVVPWNGGGPPDVHVGRKLSIPSIPEVADFWRKHDACEANPTVEQQSDSRVQISRYQSCATGAEVTLVALKGASHIWAGGGQGRSQYLDSTQTIWDFFQRHSLGEEVRSQESGARSSKG
jgi:polyhydroxybutyrate depolymerase